MRIAVTGAGGRLGGRVVELLAAGKRHDVVAVCRRATARPPSPRVTVAVADYTDLPALRAALRDVDTLVLVSSDGEAARIILHHHNLVRAAVDRGVAHVVALSGLDADLGSPFCYAFTNGHTEQILYAGGCAVSVARASIYAEFFLRWLTEARATGQIRLPAADGRISLVSRADVARCLAALAGSGPPADRTGPHDITGPESLDVSAIAAIAARAWRTPIRYVDLTPAEYIVETARSGLDPWWLYAFSSMFDSVREQRWSAVSGDVLRLTGRPPASLSDVLASPDAP